MRLDWALENMMAIYLKDAKVERLARELAKLELCTITEVVERALTERRERLIDTEAERRRRIDALLAEIHALPILDPRHPYEILYDEDGLPK